MPAGIPSVLFLSAGRPAVGEGDGPRNHRAAVDRLDSYIFRPNNCSSPSGGGAWFGRRPQSVDSFRVQLEEMEFEPLRLVFLLLMAGDSVSARWILFLQMISSEFSRFKSSVRLVLLLIADAPGVGDGDEILLLRGGSGVLRPSCEVSGLSLVRKGDDLDSPMGCLLRATVACGSSSGSSF